MNDSRIDTEALRYKARNATQRCEDCGNLTGSYLKKHCDDCNRKAIAKVFPELNEEVDRLGMAERRMRD